MRPVNGADEIKDIIVAWCPACSAARYRSKKPLGSKDAVDASVFEAVDGGYAPPAQGRATCPTCQATLRFMPQDLVPSSPEEVYDPPTRLRSNETEAPPREAPAPTSAVAPSVLTLFAVRGEEKILNVIPTPKGLLVMTTERIVFVAP